MNVDRESRRLARCVALLLRHAPDAVAADLLGRLDAPTRRFLCRDEHLPASTVTLLLRHGTDEDRRTVARNPYVLGRPLPGLPGPARYAARPPKAHLADLLGAELGHPPDEPLSLTDEELIALLRRTGARRPRGPLDVLRLHTRPGPDPGALLREHARHPLPPGSVEALLLVGRLPLPVALALLDTRAATGYGRSWHRPAVRAVRMGLATPDELVAHLAPAHRTLLLALEGGRGHGLRWSLAERAQMRSAVHRVLRPALGEDPRLWAALTRHAPGFAGTLPELAAAIAGGTAGDLAAVPPAPPVPGLERAVRALAPAPPPPAGGVERELALASLAVPNAMGDLREDIRWVRACLDRGLLTGTDVLRHKAPAAWALDEDHWLGDVDEDHWLGDLDEDPAPDAPDRAADDGGDGGAGHGGGAGHDGDAGHGGGAGRGRGGRRALFAGRAEADRLLAGALGTYADGWWRAARALPDFPGTLPELLAGVTSGDWVSNPG
ncbi:hypothetical protein [Streptomyces sp. NPDC090022]|uniref:hypothetical protein n=1 Tax=Streptomyces sp. NPDC090022 TaxID=3365920 RepID=UPI003809AE0A